MSEESMVVFTVKNQDTQTSYLCLGSSSYPRLKGDRFEFVIEDNPLNS